MGDKQNNIHDAAGRIAAKLGEAGPHEPPPPMIHPRAPSSDLLALAAAMAEGSFQALAVHWDMDGTLLDSEPLHVEKLIQACARRGVELAQRHFDAPQAFDVPDGIKGMRGASMALHGAGDKNVRHWLLAQRPELAGSLPEQAWLDELMAYYLAHADRLAPREAIDLVVQALHGIGAHQSIVTSATAPQLLACREALRDVLPLMAFAIAADDVERSKPDPQGYLRSRDRAAKHWASMGISQGSVLHLAVEDSPTGVRAALAAGLPCVHYVLPGRSPFHSENGQLLEAARSSSEVPAAMARLAARSSQSRP